MKRIPVILDTDIGTDIDDSWALLMLLRSPEVDVRLIVTADGDTDARARIAAKQLELSGFGNIPLAIGKATVNPLMPQAPWAEDYKLSDYPGGVIEDGISAMVDMINSSDEEITVLAIGPLTNIGAALEMDSSIAKKARFVGMQGSVYKGYDNSPTPSREYNIVADIKAAQKVFEAGWNMVITPVDTCDIITLKGERFLRLMRSSDKAVRVLLDAYRDWCGIMGWEHPRCNYPLASAILFDTVAVALVYREDFFDMEDINMRIDDTGMMVLDPNACKVRCAVTWKDLDGFEEFLTGRLLG